MGLGLLMRKCVILQCMLLLGGAAGGAGCQAPDAPEGPARMTVQMASEDDRSRLWKAATDILEEHYFELDRVDRLEGIITTRPETAGNWFELWRPQSPEPYHWWENNIHTMQRTATVRIVPQNTPDAVDLEVEVRRHKYHLEERAIDNAAAALRLYSSDVPTTTGQMASLARTSYTTDAGRAPRYELDLLNAILLRYQQIDPAEFAAQVEQGNTAPNADASIDNVPNENVPPPPSPDDISE